MCKHRPIASPEPLAQYATSNYQTQRTIKLAHEAHNTNSPSTAQPNVAYVDYSLSTRVPQGWRAVLRGPAGAPLHGHRAPTIGKPLSSATQPPRLSVVTMSLAVRFGAREQANMCPDNVITIPAGVSLDSKPPTHYFPSPPVRHPSSAASVGYARACSPRGWFSGGGSSGSLAGRQTTHGASGEGGEGGGGRGRGVTNHRRGRLA